VDVVTRASARRRRTALVLLALLVASSRPSLGALDDELPLPTEYEVKAAYLYHFARYVDWPSSAFPSDGAPFVIAVLGDDPFGPLLDQALEGRRIADRTTRVVRTRSVEEAARAQLVFISASETGDLPQIMRKLGRRQVLTVGDLEEMARRGAVIAFRRDRNKIRFDINPRRAEGNGLKVSSQLLRVARIVNGQGR
jgi:hypothetical protein